MRPLSSCTRAQLVFLTTTATTTLMRSVRGEAIGTPGVCVPFAGATGDDVCAFEWHWRDEVDSTMDEAERVLRARRDSADAAGTTTPLVVASKRQSRGRGTRGREWKDGNGNVMVTVALPVAGLPLRGAAVAMSPLRIGTLVHGVLTRYCTEDDGTNERRPPALTLKWPNDVLLDDAKVAGVLCEMRDDHLLVGVGVNLATAPDIPDAGPNAGRRATSLLAAAECANKAPDAETVAKDLGRAVCAWGALDGESSSRTGNDDDPATVVDDWTRLADWRTPLRLRDTGEDVLPLRLRDDGNLVVRPLEGGAERALAAEYLV